METEIERRNLVKMFRSIADRIERGELTNINVSVNVPIERTVHKDDGGKPQHVPMPDPEDRLVTLTIALRDKLKNLRDNAMLPGAAHEE